MLLEEFDCNKDAIINPNMIIEKIEDFPTVTISCFSHYLFNTLLEVFDNKKIIAEAHSATGISPIYEIEYEGEKFALYHSFVGEPSCVGVYEDIIAMGSRNLILFGNCGVLDKNIQDCGIIIPTKAIRDEGTSFHYAPPSDYIEVNSMYKELFKEVLAEKEYPYIEGTTWTTDACYRETKKKVEKRKSQGAICVEMECAGMQALCDFRNTGFFEFFYAGDNLDGEIWEPRSLSGKVKLDKKAKIALLAFELGLKIKKGER